MIFTYAVHRGHIVLARQLQHIILFKPITVNILRNIYIYIFSCKCKFISPSSNFIIRFNSTIVSLSILKKKNKLMILCRGEKREWLVVFPYQNCDIQSPNCEDKVSILKYQLKCTFLNYFIPWLYRLLLEIGHFQGHFG